MATISQSAARSALKVRVHGRSPFGASFKARLKALEQAVDQVATRAATEAERVSKDKAKALRPPAPPRKGRMDPPGALPRAINWKAASGMVELDLVRLDKQVPWWIVQEIGTNNSATIKRGGSPNKRGRPSAGSANTRKVKPQRGRRIPGSLGFGTGPRGTYVEPSATRKQQLYLLANLKGVPFGPLRHKHTSAQSLRIKNEIKPKGFIQQGAREGMRDYRREVLAAARASLVKKRP